MYTIACALKVTNQCALYVGRLSGESFTAREQDADTFVLFSDAKVKADELAAERGDLEFTVCDVIANALYTA